MLYEHKLADSSNAVGASAGKSTQPPAAASLLRAGLHGT